MRGLALVSALALSACAGGRLITWEATSCREFAGPRPWSACVTRTKGSRNPDVLYYLHGGEDDERQWSKTTGYAELIRKRWQAKGFSPPAVAAVSFGRLWLLAEKNASPESGLFEEFTGTVMPTVESQLVERPRRRLLLGESMGGFNAAVLALKCTPGGL
jgi:hypothetical protein